MYIDSEQVVILCFVFVTVASAGVSRSDVYFNMGGSQVAYSINHKPDPHGGPNAFVSVSRDEPVRHQWAHDPVLHVPVTVPTPSVYPSAVYPFVYPTTGLHAPISSHRQPKHYPAAYYPFAYSPYSPYYPYSGHPGFIFVA